MRCSVARLCERTVGRRVPLLEAGGGLLHTTPHCVVVTALGAELVSFASHTEQRWVPTGANRRRSRDRQRGTSCPKGEMSGNERVNLRRYGKPHCSLRWGLERAKHFGGWQWAEPRALRSAGVADCSVKQIELEQAVPSSRFSEELRDFHAMLVTAKHRCCQRS